MLDIKTEPMSFMSNGPYDWFVARKEVTVQWWKSLPLWQRVVGPAFVLATFVSVVVIGTALYGLVSDTSSFAAAEIPAVTQTSAPSKQSTGAAATAAAPSSDALGLVQQNINQLVTGQEETQKNLTEVRTVTNSNTNEIKSVKTDVGAVKEIISKEDPKLLKALRDDLERLKKIMAVPPVQLTPMSALEVHYKAA